ncbi:MAG: hypothetical protein H0U91_04780 [Rubrobacter sp.]|nr:hypothetical protein [Rubrobacter sp.]
MNGWMDLELARERRRELLREADGRRLAREAARPAAGKVEEKGISVRWGLVEDEAAVADLLQLNGMPRWVAFEERFIVAERDGKIVGAVRYATESKRISLGLLVVNPWGGERRTSRALYRGAVDLAGELGASDVLATKTRGSAYPGESGYRRAGRGWRSPVPSEGGRGHGGFLRALLHLWGTRAALPFYRVPR